jgi:2,4-dienoyl-CoA reductase-like NADH-dependent reductase (Old Yellow Enzyme family)
MKNRFMLAPMTNCQSHPDGRLSEEEFNWLAMRARGNFGLTMTCAAFIHPTGQGFPGQLGISSDDHFEGLSRLASAVRLSGSLSAVQLYHGGARAPANLVARPVSASNDEATGARGLTLDEVDQLIEDFVAAAVRAQRAGFDGIELHGAHGYILAQFLSAELNRRKDRYGGSLENRARIIGQIVDGVRARCRPDFQVGLRISPEHFGMKLSEMIELAQEMFNGNKLDYLDLSLWDFAKEPEDAGYKGASLLSLFTKLRRGNTRLGCAGNISSGAAVERVLNEGTDFALVGRAAILHHDLPLRLQQNPGFAPRPLPVAKASLGNEGLSATFLTYLEAFPGFLISEESAMGRT